MNKLKYFIVILSLFLFMPSVNAKTKLYFFHGDGCPHCAEEEKYLETLKDKYPDLEVVEYEVWYNEENADVLKKVKTNLDKDNNYVPFTVIGEDSYTGYNESFNNAFTSSIEKCLDETCIDVVSKTITGENIDKEDTNKENNVDEDITLPLIGKVSKTNVSLPIAAIVIGLVDGFNPCAMWILLFLISMMIGMKNRKRMLILGLTFLVTSSLVYALFMVAWLNIVITMTQVNMIKFIIAIVAIIGAIWNLYSFYKSIKKDTGCVVVNNTKRKKIISKIKKCTTKKSLILALTGIITLAISVNFVELACSAGWPLVFTELLALNNLSSFQYGIYIFLYILFYLLDDIVIFVIALVTFKITAISNKYSKYSHLVGGILMLLIGLLMLFKPEWLMLNF